MSTASSYSSLTTLNSAVTNATKFSSTKQEKAIGKAVMFISAVKLKGVLSVGKAFPLSSSFKSTGNKIVMP